MVARHRGATVVLRLAVQIEISGWVFSPAGSAAGAKVVGMPGGTANGTAFRAQPVTAAMARLRSKPLPIE